MSLQGLVDKKKTSERKEQREEINNSAWVEHQASEQRYPHVNWTVCATYYTVLLTTRPPPALGRFIPLLHPTFNCSLHLVQFACAKMQRGTLGQGCAIRQEAADY
jgi:hypothetical protein